MLLLDNSTVNIIFSQTQKLRFTVLLFDQVTKVFGLLYSVILTSLSTRIVKMTEFDFVR